MCLLAVIVGAIGELEMQQLRHTQSLDNKARLIWNKDFDLFEIG